jgi:hypothetical protein
MTTDPIDEAPRLTIDVSFDVKSGLFLARLDNGTRFNFSPANVSGKLGSNLDLLRAFTQRNAKGQPPQPHIAALPPYDPDEDLIANAIANGKLQKVGVFKTPRDADLIDF